MNENFDPAKHKQFVPKNKEKYKGSSYPVARSSWESTFMNWCDTNPAIIEWGSEMFGIPYYDPVSGRKRKYYPDFVMKVIDRSGSEKIFIVEIKPEKETKEPKRGRKTQKTVLYEQKTYLTNQAKWKAAEDFCSRKGIIFKIITENELFNKK